MKSIFQSFTVLILLTILLTKQGFAQIGRGVPSARRVGNQNGNEVRTTFTNWGVIGQPGSQGTNVAWKYNANGYATDIQPLVGVRLPIKDYRVGGVYNGIPDTLYSVIGCNADRSGIADYDPSGGTFWGFEPIPGFFNPAINEIGVGVAMSNQPRTWPSFWPDHPDWVDKNGNAEWNGYFGRGQMNADQESYFMMDDNVDQKMFRQYAFLPDSTDPTRKGQGLRVLVRGLQWRNILAQDVIFWLYEVENVGTSFYDQVCFGTLVGTYVGVGPMGGTEYIDDASFFNIRESIVYTWDYDHHINPSANPNWEPTPDDVGYIGYAFLESPGNDYDGIDNDGDNIRYGGTAPFFTDADFSPRTINIGDRLILIKRNNNYERISFIMPDTAVTVNSMGQEIHLIPGITVLQEGNMVLGGTLGTRLNKNAYDGLDNDLDGLIDENYQVHYRQYKETTAYVVLIDTIAPVQHFDYVNNLGLSDLMIDEGRDDGIDNDGDWDPTKDDVGADGKAGTHDVGEGDGFPTEGEPNFDSKDVDESDQLGLTSFDYFVPSTDIDMSNENAMWQRMTPGRFDVPESVVKNRATRGEDGDFIFGTGYFSLPPGKKRRFSLALVFGNDYDAVVRSKNIAQLIYNSNYNFPKAPDKPTLTAVPGDGKVTLYWDKVAEGSYDKSLQEFDFEGYKIFRSTDPYFNDVKTITNGYGQKVDYQPVKQFDLVNNIFGFFNYDPILNDKNSATPFYLGEDSGIQNSYVDEALVNGRTYYYAVCAYDHGRESESIFPSQNPMTITINAAGQVFPDQNTAVVVPNAPVTGYKEPTSGVAMKRVEGVSTHTPYVEVVNPALLKNTTYTLTFSDTVRKGVLIAYTFNIIDSASGDIILKNNHYLREKNGDVFDGLRISFNTAFQNPDSIRLDTTRSGWNNPDTSNLTPVVSIFEWGNIVSTRSPEDYMLVFNNEWIHSSSRLTSIFGNNSPLQILQTNFAIYDITDSRKPLEIQYGFVESPSSPRDTLSHFDSVYLSNEDGSVLSWRVVFTGQKARPPLAGDTLYLSFFKPFSEKDVFSFRSQLAVSDQALAEEQMDRIKVVPNPYMVTNIFEKPLSSQVRGRGERVVYFTHLPANSTIKIYASNGHHVQTLEHGGNIMDGTCQWDLRSREGLDVAFGVYFYVVEAQGIQKKRTGKLAIIK